MRFLKHFKPIITCDFLREKTKTDNLLHTTEITFRIVQFKYNTNENKIKPMKSFVTTPHPHPQKNEKRK